MTKIYITNQDNATQADKYWIEIECTGLEFDDQTNMQNNLELAKSLDNQTAASTTWFIDLQKRSHMVTITGRIDKYCALTAPPGGIYYEDAVHDIYHLVASTIIHDVSVIRKRLQYMQDLGGTNKLYIGYGDAYCDRTNTPVNETWVGSITKINFKESDADHVNRAITATRTPTAADSINYPGGYTNVVLAYDIVLQFRLGETIPLS